MLKRILFTVTLLVLAVFTLEGTNAHAEGTKIGVMNMQKVLVESSAGIKAKAILEEKGKELEAKLKAKADVLIALQEEIKKKETAWNDEMKGVKYREFQKKQLDLQAEEKDAQAELKQLEMKELDPIFKMLQTVVNTYGQKNGYAVILDSKAGVHFASNEVEISDAIKKELDKRMK